VGEGVASGLIPAVGILLLPFPEAGRPDVFAAGMDQIFSYESA
jgi:hypothetical protein